MFSQTRNSTAFDSGQRFNGRINGSIYTEVIKYSTLLKRASMRNQIFLEKLRSLYIPVAENQVFSPLSILQKNSMFPPKF